MLVYNIHAQVYAILLSNMPGVRVLQSGKSRKIGTGSIGKYIIIASYKHFL